jgi:hypothetical protein
MRPPTRKPRMAHFIGHGLCDITYYLNHRGNSRANTMPKGQRARIPDHGVSIVAVGRVDEGRQEAEQLGQARQSVRDPRRYLACVSTSGLSRQHGCSRQPHPELRLHSYYVITYSLHQLELSSQRTRWTASCTGHKFTITCTNLTRRTF